jgi:uncharacterized protein (DUF58 family)
MSLCPVEPQTSIDRLSLDPESLAKIRGLRLRARHIVEGYVAGLHRSPYRGFSIEFAEHRDYVPGDDLRYVDWKVYGKSDKLYLKQFEDETNLSCYLALDVSQSMTYRGRGAAMSKLEYASSLAAALAWLLLQQQDAVGLATFAGKIEGLIRPAATPSNLQHILQALESVVPGKETSLGISLQDLGQRLTRRGVAIVLSDFFDDVAAIAGGLARLRHRRHDVIAVQILDPAETDFSFAAETEFVDLETGAMLTADPRFVRAAYLRELSVFRQSLEFACRKEGVDYFLVRTDERMDLALAAMLSKRRRRAG